ncbi:MAG: alpha-L-fucosidase 2, partial [Streptomyces sp.]|nr:alpha-L-fucosidase 2 [Streptomyces sp.]
YWNTTWTNAAGTNTIYVGSSSRDIRLTGTTTIPASGGGTTPPGQTIAITLRAHADNQYVCAENAGAAALIANRTAIGLWETFDEIDLGNGAVALRSHANNKYVTTPNSGSGSLIASSTTVGTAETFDLIHDPDGAVTLRAHSNNMYVTAENAGAASLIANRTAIGPWEEFDLIQD